MGKTIRNKVDLIWERRHDPYTVKVREKTCKPGCGVCGKDRHTRRQERVSRRSQDRAAIREQT